MQAVSQLLLALLLVPHLLPALLPLLLLLQGQLAKCVLAWGSAGSLGGSPSSCSVATDTKGCSRRG